MMKCVTYVSKFIVSTNGAMIPSGLSEIYSLSRVKNREFNITGVISYQQGRYIHVIEGDDDAVDQLLENIKKDTRHREVQGLLDFPISSRFFEGEYMKMLPSVKDDLDFIKFINSNHHAISFLDAEQLKLLEFFYNPTHGSSKLVQDFSGKELMLTAWPDFTVVMPSPTIVELCARLIREPFLYDDLLSSEEFGDEDKLNKTLITFNALGILKVLDAESVEDAPAPVKEKPKPTGFYMKMKAFLGFKE